MRFLDLNGNVINKSILKYKLWSDCDGNESSPQRLVKQALFEIFPNTKIYGEVPCFGTNLHIDLFIPILNLVVEVDGDQHTNANHYFHRTPLDFVLSKQRDFKKEQWCGINGFHFIRIKESEAKSKNLHNIIRTKLNEIK